MTKQSYGDQNGRSKREAPAKKSRFNDVKFISCDLTGDDKQRCKSWEYTEVHAFADLDAITEEYRVSFKYDSYGHCSGCFIQPIDSDHEDAGYVLCGRGSSPLKALKQAIFTWRVLGGGNTWKQFDKNREYDLDD